LNKGPPLSAIDSKKKRKKKEIAQHGRSLALALTFGLEKGLQLSTVILLTIVKDVVQLHQRQVEMSLEHHGHHRIESRFFFFFVLESMVCIST
jgi:hypothetical protein